MKTIPISVTVLTKNCQDTLESTLRSVALFEEVVVLDTGSSDATLNIAKTFPNVVVHTADFNGFGPMHNVATSLASRDWVLSLDSDEVLSEGLIEEIQNLDLDPINVYFIQRFNYFNDKHIKWCGGWHPDIVCRLYHRKTTHFNDVPVHEKIMTNGLVEMQLAHPIFHTPYRKMSDFLTKMQTYTSLFAQQHQGKKRSSFFKALYHGWFAFLKSYVFKKGFLGGKEGFLISLYNSHTAFYKYLKLAESNRSIPK
ncbi:MAG TPA: glycosyltransferase family 2 protein [Chlamydiales bacterium]|nr:glycosyltransferase family 2 protein [Chlamydiales bacterium]